MAKNSAIAILNEAGQSIWYDNLSRDVLLSGKLRSYIEVGVSGLTSNPTIFKKAIADTSNYDEDIRSLSAQRKLEAEAICEELMIQDVGAAADLLRSTYDSTQGADGYASIEVSPNLARDTTKTIDAAKAIWRKLGRPNIMIKIPATDEGLPAIQSVLDAGINVNITLIFSISVYEKVAECYLSALETRMRRGETVRNIASVASFFVSRVDSICEGFLDKLQADGKIKAPEAQSFLGKVGNANSKLAYESFLKIFGSDRFRAIEQQGARVQRPLWASTGTKNPAFDPLLYIDNLAGRNTVNTVPPATLDKIMERGSQKCRLREGVEDAKSLLLALKSKGVPFDDLLFKLQVDGVRLFADSYRELVEAVQSKKEALNKT